MTSDDVHILPPPLCSKEIKFLTNTKNKVKCFAIRTTDVTKCVTDDKMSINKRFSADNCEKN